MKPSRVTYYDGKKLDFTYNYRGFEYSREFKSLLNCNGLKISKCIDNFLDRGAYKISLEDKEYIYELIFKEYCIFTDKVKKESI